MKKDILICGVGGQGTVLASKIIAASAMDEGSAVHSAETIGMAQRGGSVTSHVRIGEAYAELRVSEKGWNRDRESCTGKTGDRIFAGYRV